MAICLNFAELFHFSTSCLDLAAVSGYVYLLPSTNLKTTSLPCVENESIVIRFVTACHNCDLMIRFGPCFFCSVSRWDLSEGEISMEAKVFKTNPNSRDLKGWSCVCIGIFHESKECLSLLLNHGGDPLLRSSYNKNAWDLAKVQWGVV